MQAFVRSCNNSVHCLLYKYRYAVRFGRDGFVFFETGRRIAAHTLRTFYRSTPYRQAAEKVIDF